MIPGLNILGMALRVITPTSVKYYENIGQRTAADGTQVTMLASASDLNCTSVQPVDRSRYNDLGLSFQKCYFELFVVHEISGVARGKAGDVVEWQGRRYQVVSDTPWYDLDSWTPALIVDIGVATGELTLLGE